jgi:hypothetical protein
MSLASLSSTEYILLPLLYFISPRLFIYLFIFFCLTTAPYAKQADGERQYNFRLESRVTVRRPLVKA